LVIANRPDPELDARNLTNQACVSATYRKGLMGRSNLAAPFEVRAIERHTLCVLVERTREDFPATPVPPIHHGHPFLLVPRQS
jgi:hypothetical protein